MHSRSRVAWREGRLDLNHPMIRVQLKGCGLQNAKVWRAWRKGSELLVLTAYTMVEKASWRNYQLPQYKVCKCNLSQYVVV